MPVAVLMGAVAVAGMEEGVRRGVEVSVAMEEGVPPPPPPPSPPLVTELDAVVAEEEEAVAEARGEKEALGEPVLEPVASAVTVPTGDAEALPVPAQSPPFALAVGPPRRGEGVGCRVVKGVLETKPEVGVGAVGVTVAAHGVPVAA